MAAKDPSGIVMKILCHIYKSNELTSLAISAAICLISLIWMIPLIPVDGFQSAVGVGFIYFVTMICMTLVIRPLVNPGKRLCERLSSKTS